MPAATPARHTSGSAPPLLLFSSRRLCPRARIAFSSSSLPFCTSAPATASPCCLVLSSHRLLLLCRHTPALLLLGLLHLLLSLAMASACCLGLLPYANSPTSRLRHRLFSIRRTALSRPTPSAPRPQPAMSLTSLHAASAAPDSLPSHAILLRSAFSLLASALSFDLLSLLLPPRFLLFPLLLPAQPPSIFFFFLSCPSFSHQLPHSAPVLPFFFQPLLPATRFSTMPCHLHASAIPSPSPLHATSCPRNSQPILPPNKT